MTAPPALLALAAALGFALARTVLKRALQHSTPLTAVAVSVLFTAAFLTGIAALTAPLSQLVTWLMAPFIAAGLLAPGVGRLLTYVGIDRLGAARASAVSAAAPLFAVVLAIVLLGERPSWSLLVGAACIVGGGILLSQRDRTSTAWRRRDLVFPALGALAFASRDIVSRWGLRSFPHPSLAAVAATLTSVAVILLFGLRQRGQLRADRAGVGLLLLSGLCEALGSLALWSALGAGDVSVVTPLAHAQPIFTVILAVLFLRDLEQVTWRVGLATLVMVGGAIAVVRG
jgi:DME family drug/metabolite transporter